MASQSLFNQANSNISVAKAEINYYQGLVTKFNTPNYGLGTNATPQQLQSFLNTFNSQLFPTSGPAAGSNALTYYQNLLATSTGQAQSNSPQVIGSFNGSSISLNPNVSISQQITGNLTGSTQNLGTAIFSPTLGSNNSISLAFQSFTPANVTLTGGYSITDPITGKVYPIGASIGATTTYNQSTGAKGLTFPTMAMAISSLT